MDVGSCAACSVAGNCSVCRAAGLTATPSAGATVTMLASVTKDAAEGFVREVVSNKVSLLATDESRVYGGLTDYPHKEARRRQVRCRRGPHQYD